MRAKYVAIRFTAVSHALFAMMTKVSRKMIHATNAVNGQRHTIPKVRRFAISIDHETIEPFQLVHARLADGLTTRNPDDVSAG